MPSYVTIAMKLSPLVALVPYTGTPLRRGRTHSVDENYNIGRMSEKDTYNFRARPEQAASFGDARLGSRDRMGPGWRRNCHSKVGWHERAGAQWLDLQAARTETR